MNQIIFVDICVRISKLKVLFEKIAYQIKLLVCNVYFKSRISINLDNKENPNPIYLQSGGVEFVSTMQSLDGRKIHFFRSSR